MQSIIIVLPNDLLSLLPQLALGLGLDEIELSVALGPNPATATHSAGHLWRQLPSVAALNMVTPEWASTTLIADEIGSLMARGRIDISVPEANLSPRARFETLIAELGLVRVIT